MIQKHTGKLVLDLSVTSFFEISSLWQLLEAQWRVYLVLGKILNLFYQIFYAIGQISIPVNGQILNK